MSKVQVLVVATRNPGKLREMRALLAQPGLRLASLDELGMADEVEEGPDYAENAARKALAAATSAGLWAVGDDSGLEVDALDGAPGPHSARLAGPQRTDADRRFTLLRLLAPYPRPWTARFRCTVVLASPQGGVDRAVGICPGQVIPEARGSGGFGYDPIFQLDGREETMSELSEGEKNRLSHRARAVRALLPVLRRRLGLDAGEGASLPPPTRPPS
jgi:XTP/dITP diphosphohydrolase